VSPLSSFSSSHLPIGSVADRSQLLLPLQHHPRPRSLVSKARLPPEQARNGTSSFPTSLFVPLLSTLLCHVSPVRLFLKLIFRLLIARSLHRRHRNRYSARRHQGQGEGSVAQAEDARASSTQDGQDRYRLPEAARRLLQVPDQA